MVGVASTKQTIQYGRARGELRLASLAVTGWLLLCSFAVPAASFTATLDRDTVVLGETAALSLTFENGQPTRIPTPPQIPNVVISGPQQERSFNMTVGGQQSDRLTLKYFLRPLQPGDYSIPALSAEVGGQTHVSQPLTLRAVRAATGQPNTANAGPALAFLRLILPKEKFYVGEVFVAELQLLVHGGAANAHDFTMPAITGEGLNAGKAHQLNQRQAQVGSTVYKVVPFQVPITVLQPGKLPIGPADASVVVEIPSRRARSRDPFDMFDFPSIGIFSRTEPRRVPLTLPKHEIEALPLPTENVPPDFNGAVGQFQMSVSAGPTNIAVGDPITVKVQIAGQGALGSLTLPDHPGWKDFKSYPPSTKLDSNDPLGIRGLKTFEQVVVPENTEIRELPPITFSFFDPESDAYKTIRHPATPLIVRPAGSAPAPALATDGSGEDTDTSQQDIVHIKARLGSLAQMGPPLPLRPGFLALQAVPIALCVGAFVWRKRRESFAANPRLRRRKRVAQLMRNGREDLRHHAAENHSDEFFATLFHLLQEQLGERLDQPASSITEAVVEEKLRPLGVPASVLAELHQLFQACNLARYAPVQDSQELAAFIPRLEEVIENLQEVRV